MGMGRLLLISRLVAGDIRRRPVQSALLLVVIATTATTLALGLTLRHVAQSPFGKDFELELTISTEIPRAISISRVPEHEEDDEHLALVWHIERGSAATVTLEFVARISVLPGWLPVGDAGDVMAAAAVEAALGALEESLAPARQRA